MGHALRQDEEAALDPRSDLPIGDVGEHQIYIGCRELTRIEVPRALLAELSRCTPNPQSSLEQSLRILCEEPIPADEIDDEMVSFRHGKGGPTPDQRSITKQMTPL